MRMVKAVERRLVPQGVVTNFYNRVKEDGTIVQSLQRGGGSRRSRAVNYSEVDAFEDFEESDDERQGSNNRSASTEAVVDDKVPENVVLPDLEDIITGESDPSLNVLKFRKVRDTFFGGRIAIRYKLELDQNEVRSSSLAVPIIVPITLKLEDTADGISITDSLLWNINDTSVTPEQFSLVYCRDLGILGNNYIQQQIATLIRDQIENYRTLSGHLLQANENMRSYPDFHVHLNIACNLNSRYYEDNFQWNINDESLTPEKFATIVVKDLGLTRDFLPSISQVLHEQLLQIKKEWIKGEFNHELIHPDENNRMVRIEANQGELDRAWSPRVEVLSMDEIQKREVERERQLRRMKRDSDRLGRRGRRK